MVPRSWKKGAVMKKYDVMDTSNAYTYGLDLSKIKFDLPKSSKKCRTAVKRYICIDLEMTEFTAGQRSLVPGVNGEVIQFGAVMLDENYNMISKFSSYVKPSYSSVTPAIQKLTGISNNSLQGADDFITVFDKFSYWRGDGDITTFTWSKTDHNQLWNELEAKGQHRYDLFSCLKNFVDLQEIFGKLVSSRTAVSLESAIRLLQMDYEGQVHTAYSDSYNTARILHKLFCTDSLELDFDYINPNSDKLNKNDNLKDLKENYSCSFASFISPELLAQFGYSVDSEEDNSETYEDYGVDDDIELLESSPLTGLIDNEEISTLCSKYKISFNKWLKLATEVMETKEMLVA